MSAGKNQENTLVYAPPEKTLQKPERNSCTLLRSLHAVQGIRTSVHAPPLMINLHQSETHCTYEKDK